MKTFNTIQEAYDYINGKTVKSICINKTNIVVYEDGDNITATTSQTIEEARESAKYRIDCQSECLRSLAITTLPGQTMEYSYTETEARKFLAGSDTTLANYPYLAAEMMALEAINQSITPRQLAELVIYETSTYGMFGAAIKFPRRLAKLKIDAAQTVEEITNIEENISWPTI